MTKPTRVKLVVHYRRGHSIPETWSLALWFCPSCAQQRVWEREGDGDYYQGTQTMCAACGFWFYMPSCGEAEGRTSSETYDLQRLNAIRNYKP